MKLVSFNVNGIRAILQKNFKETFSFLDADIFFIEETKYSEDLHIDFPYNNPNYHIYWTNSKLRKGYSGVAVFSKKEPINVFYGLENQKYDDEGRIITLEFDNFYFVGAYVPNSGENLKRLDFRLGYEQDIKAYLKKLDLRKPVIYTGDLNVAHNEIDLKNPNSNHQNAGFTDQERSSFTALLNDGYIDSYRFLYPTNIKYSWWSYRFQARKNNSGWRIDYFLVSERIKDKIVDSKIYNDIFGSDHCPIELDIDL